MILVQHLILLVSPLFTLSLFGYVFGQRRKNRLNAAFLALIAISTIESLFDFSFRVTDSVILREIFLAIATSLFFSLGFAFLNLTYAHVNKKRDFAFNIAGITSALCSIVPLMNVSLYSVVPENSDTFVTAIPNQLFLLIFVLYFCPVTIYGTILLIRQAAKSLDNADKKYLFIWICGVIVTIFSVSCISFILPRSFKITFFSPFSSLSLIITSIFTYGLVRRKNFTTVNVTQLEEILEKVFSEAGEAILLIDQYHYIVRANNAAVRFFNLDKLTMNKLSLTTLIPDLCNTHKNNPFETAITISGVKHSILVSVVSLHTADESVNMMITVRDITRIKQAEKELFRQQQLESLGLLAGGIAHDFNNLLCGIVSSFGFAKLSVGPDSECAGILLEGEKAALNARCLTQQLLTFAKGGEPVTTIFNPIEVLKDTSTFSIRGSNISLNFELPAELMCMHADEGQIRQVFQNLVINACQAMPHGGLITIRGQRIQISEAQLPPLSAGQYLKVAVIDQGTGISPQLLSRIFEPYFTTKKGGNGIGLAIVSRILAQHKGHITVDSEMGKGTVFTVYLPVSSPDSTSGISSSTLFDCTYKGSGRVLVMDDDDIIRKTLAALLQKLGYAVDTTQNGEEALEKFDYAAKHGENYTLVIVDLMVCNGMGGKTLTREIARRNSSIPIVISSGYSDDFCGRTEKDICATAYLRKPYNIKELQAVLQNVS